jgi:hypothetical protein
VAAERILGDFFRAQILRPYIKLLVCGTNLQNVCPLDLPFLETTYIRVEEVENQVTAPPSSLLPFSFVSGAICTASSELNVI